MELLKKSLLIVLFLILSLSLNACQQTVNGQKSPSGDVTVTFEVTKDFKSKGTGDLDDISYVEYKVSFYKSGELIAADKFTNVYGWTDEAKPRDITKIFEDFTWSPKEDFVILPEEEWPGAPGSPVYTSLNLNSEMKWEKAVISMHIETWYGDMMVFGNVADDCHLQVEMFDGSNGKTKIIAKAESPVGYEIIDAQGGILFIKSLLDNCRLEGDMEKFKVECYEYDIAAMKLTQRVCR